MQKIFILILAILFLAPPLNAVAQDKKPIVMFDIERMQNEMIDDKGDEGVFLTRTKDIRGMLLLHDITTESVFIIENHTKKPINFKKAEYRAIGNDDSLYKLDFQEIKGNSGEDKSFILDPEETIIISCKNPVNPKEVREYYILLKNKEKIIFIPSLKYSEYSTTDKDIDKAIEDFKHYFGKYYDKALELIDFMKQKMGIE